MNHQPPNEHYHLANTPFAEESQSPTLPDTHDDYLVSPENFETDFSTFSAGGERSIESTTRLQPTLFTTGTPLTEDAASGSGSSDSGYISLLGQFTNDLVEPETLHSSRVLDQAGELYRPTKRMGRKPGVDNLRGVVDRHVP